MRNTTLCETAEAEQEVNTRGDYNYRGEETVEGRM